MKVKSTEQIKVRLIETLYIIIQIPLNKYEKIIYQRYIRAEKQITDFIKLGKASEFNEDAFIFIYVAGHGCADDR